MKQFLLSIFLKLYAQWAGATGKPYPNSVLLLPPYSPGSYGDAAVVTSFVENLASRGIERIGLIKYQDSDDWSFVNGISETFSLEDYFHYEAWKIRFSFCKKISEYEQFFILGTDVMDGYYSPKDSLERIYLTELGAQTGRSTRIVSFSFNAHPISACVTALRHLSSSVHLLSRDPVSQKRLESHLQRPVTLTADIAFLLKPREGNISAGIEQWIDEQQKDNGIVVGINANHVLVEKFSEITIEKLVKAYQEALQEIHAAYPDIRFLFIPHDIRGDASDVVIAEAIFRTLPPNLQQVSKIVPSPCHPAEIKHIVSRLSFVLSGKMHLAIACLSQGVPVACIAYQDKFEGLFQHFEMEDMSLAPEELLLPGKLSQFFLERFNKKENLSAQIQTHLPRVLQLAEKNLV